MLTNLTAMVSKTHEYVKYNSLKFSEMYKNYISNISHIS